MRVRIERSPYHRRYNLVYMVSSIDKLWMCRKACEKLLHRKLPDSALPLEIELTARVVNKKARKR